MPGISIHVVDVASGLIAVGLRVALSSVGKTSSLIAQGEINSKGLFDDTHLERTFEPGYYEAVLHVGEFYRMKEAARGPAKAKSSEAETIQFLDVVTYRFGIQDSAQHFHLPFKITAWGYSCFRGGA